MIPRVPIGSRQITMDDVWAYYEALRAGIVRSADAATRSLADGTSPQDPTLFGMSLDEVAAYFEGLLDEADKQASLFLIAAAEATLRVDFLERVYQRRRDPVSRVFRNVYKTRRDHNKVNVRLEDDILDTWAAEVPGAKSHVGTFKGALRFRHWLAHGRYWVPKLGQRYDPSGLVQIIADLFDRIGLANN